MWCAVAISSDAGSWSRTWDRRHRPKLPPLVAPFPVPTGFEQIHDYQVAVTTTADGGADFVETIQYDFGSTPDRHGILRDLRLTQPCNDQWQRVYPMTNLTVSSPTGAPTGVKLDSSNGVTTARVGDADKNVHGVQTYVVRYHLAGVINRFADHDEFYWNAIGPDWDVMVWNGVVQVTRPGPTGPHHVLLRAGRIQDRCATRPT